MKEIYVPCPVVFSPVFVTFMPSLLVVHGALFYNAWVLPLLGEWWGTTGWL